MVERAFTSSEGLPASPVETASETIPIVPEPISSLLAETVETTHNLDAWTPQTVTKLLFLSFRHSQGSPELQDCIFTYIRYRYGVQAIPDAWARPVKANVRTAIRSYLQVVKGKNFAPASFHLAVPSSLVAPEVRRAFTSLKAAVEEPDPFDYHIVATITTNMVFRELWYFIRRSGRPRGEAAGRDPIHADPFFSYVRYYAIEGHSTGVAVLDVMYQDMAAYIQKSRTQDVTDAEEYPSLLDSGLLAQLDAIVSRDLAKLRER